MHVARHSLPRTTRDPRRVPYVLARSSCRQHLPTSTEGRPLFSFNNWGLRQSPASTAICGRQSLDAPRHSQHDPNERLASLAVAPHIAERLVNHVSAQSDMERTYDLYAYIPMKCGLQSSAGRRHFTSYFGLICVHHDAP